MLIPGGAVDNHPGQNVYYVCVFNPETEEFVHQGSAKHLQVNIAEKIEKRKKTEIDRISFYNYTNAY